MRTGWGLVTSSTPMVTPRSATPTVLIRFGRSPIARVVSAQRIRIEEFSIPTQTQASSTQPFWYAAQQRDADDGLYYLRFRVDAIAVLRSDPARSQIARYGRPIRAA